MHLYCGLISAWMGFLLLFGPTIDGHEYDLCGMGSAYVSAFNINLTYQGLDSSNSDYPVWTANCRNATLEWGGKWGYPAYFLKLIGNVLLYYGYCADQYALPLDCQHWMISNGTAVVLNNDYRVRNCSYYTERSVCQNNTYLIEAGMEPSGEWCIHDLTYRQDLNGTYQVAGCYEGFPWYLHTDDKLFFWDWCWGRWAFLDTTFALSADCYALNLTKCKESRFYALENSQWYLDTGVNFIPGCTPTDTPTHRPTMLPTAPSESPTYRPTVPPSPAPTLIPSNAPTIPPSVAPTMNPTMTPTQMPSTTEDSGFTKLFGGVESTIYMLLGFGITLLVCWILCCFWYVRRRRTRLKEGIAIANSPSSEPFATDGVFGTGTAPAAGAGIIKAVSPSGQNPSAPVAGRGGGGGGITGAPMAGAGMGMGMGMGPNVTGAPNGPFQAPMMMNTMNTGPGGAGGEGKNGNTTNSYQAQMVAMAMANQQRMQQQMQQQQLAQMQNTLRMQQMQQQQMLQQQMAMLQNASRMPQPQVQPPLGAPMHQQQGIAGGQQVVMGPNGIPMQTNAAAMAFTNGVANVYTNGGEAGGGAGDDSSSSSDNVAFYHPPTSKGGPGPQLPQGPNQGQPPPSYMD